MPIMFHSLCMQILKRGRVAPLYGSWALLGHLTGASISFYRITGNIEVPLEFCFYLMEIGG